MEPRIRVIGVGFSSVKDGHVRFTLYICFAVLSSLINVLSQSAVMAWVSLEQAYFLALFTGTAAGWITKYTLDKKCVFDHKTNSHTELAGNMATHASVGVGTTLLFWAIESVFHFYVSIPGAMYIGAALGLAICYTIRYQIDRLVVFRPVTQPG